MRYRKPEEFQETEIKWLQNNPNHWDERKAKFLFKKMERPVREKDDIVTAFRDGEVTLRKNRRTEGFTNSIKEIGYQGIREGDLVIHEMDGFAGAIGVSDSNGKSSPVYTVCRPEDPLKVNNNFYAYVLRNMALTGYIESLSQGIRQRSTDFRFNVFKEEILPIPPLAEQRSITTFLDRKTEAIDGLIQKKEQLIERLKEKRQVLITQAVTKGLNPDVPMKDSGIEWMGEIPEKWDIAKLKFLSVVKRGASPRPIDDQKYFDENGDYAWVRISDVTASHKYLENTEQTLSELGASKSVKLEPGELILSIAASVGKPIINRIKCCIHDGFIYFKNLQLDTKFAYYLFASGEPYKGLGKLGTQLNLNSETVGSIFSPIPSKSEQVEIAKNLDEKTKALDKTINKTENVIEKLKEYRQSLISTAVTGKIDVRDEVEEAKTVEKSYDLEDIMPLVMYFLDECHRRQVFYGRLMAVKNYFLLHHLLKIQGLTVHFKRYPKGPHDPDFWDQLEQKLISKRWITVKQEAGKKSKVSYSPNRTVNYKTKLEEEFEHKLDIIRKVVNELAQHDSDHAEVLATVYAAWNDLLLFDKEPTEENILHQVLHRWPGEEKQKISKSEWKQGIRRLKSLGIEPTEGFGKPTTDQIELL